MGPPVLLALDSDGDSESAVRGRVSEKAGAGGGRKCCWRDIGKELAVLVASVADSSGDVEWLDCGGTSGGGCLVLVRFRLLDVSPSASICLYKKLRAKQGMTL